MADKKKVDGTARREFLQGAGATAVAATMTPNLLSAAVAGSLGGMRSPIPGLGAADTDAIRTEI